MVAPRKRVAMSEYKAMAECPTCDGGILDTNSETFETLNGVTSIPNGGLGQDECPEVCGGCHEEIEPAGYFQPSVAFLGDGDIYCEACCDTTCPDCKGEGETSLPMIEGYPTVESSCSCCGASPRNPGYDAREPDGRSYPWYVVRAGRIDSDGIPMPFLCCDETGEGCLQDVEDKPTKNEAMLRDLMPDDPDGLASTLEDFRYIGLLGDGQDPER